MTFEKWAIANRVSLKLLFPGLQFEEVASPHMSVNSDFFGTNRDHENLEVAGKRIKAFQNLHPSALLANGYLEQRSFYNTKAYERVRNGSAEFRNIHLGTDFWVPAGTAVHACYDGTVEISHNNDYHKDYGPTLVIKHRFGNDTFYTLYGHLSSASLSLSKKGKQLKQGDLLGYIGNESENGHWVPHLHFQLITDLLGETENYNGVAYPSEINRWKTLCPDPNLIFHEELPAAVAP